MTKLKLILSGIFIAAALNSCGIWTNFTTYFNTYFNATDAMEKAEKSIEKNRTELFEFQPKPLPNNAKAPLNKVIAKCSSILQFNSDSDFFDDALFLIGKSFYYQQNYSKALRKFNELASVPESELNLTAKLWVGKCQLQLRNFESGLKTLNEVTEEAKQQNQNDIIVQAEIVRISYLISRDKYEDAVAECRSLIEASDDEELKAEVAYEMGKLYVKMEDIEKAVSAFAEALTYSPTYEIEFYSKFEFARGKAELGNIDESLKLMRELRDEDKNQDYFDMIELEIAQIYYKKGDYDTAMDMFTVIDTTYKNTESVGTAVFTKAEMWEHIYSDYDSAKYYYDRANSIKDATIDTRKNARTRALTIAKYLKIRDEYRKNLLGIVYLTNPKKFESDSLDYALYLERKKAIEDSIREANQGRRNVRNALAGQAVSGRRGRSLTGREAGKKSSQNQKNLLPEIPKPEKPEIPVDSILVLNDDLKYQMANMFFSELEAPDSAKSIYLQILDSGLNKKIIPQTLYALGTYYSTINNQQKADSLFRIVYDKYPDTDIARDAAKRLKLTFVSDDDPAASLYSEGENYLLDSNFEAAISKFRKIAEEYPKSPLAAKSLYAIGFIFENELDISDSAIAVYDTLDSKYSNSIYARAAKPKLSVYEQMMKAREDSLNKKPDSLAADVKTLPKYSRNEQIEENKEIKTKPSEKEATKEKIPPPDVKGKSLPQLKKELDKLRKLPAEKKQPNKRK